MAIDTGGYHQKNSRAVWQRYGAAPEQKSAGTGSCPRAPLQKRPKSSVQAHSKTGMQTYSLLLRIQQRWAERNYYYYLLLDTPALLLYQRLSISCCMYFSPEAVIDIDGLYYNVGGLLTHMPRAYLNRTALAENVTFDPSAFHFISFQTGKPEAPFHYRPRRGAPEDIVWPPRGLRVDIQFKAPFWAPFYHQVTFHMCHYFCCERIHTLLDWSLVVVSNIC